MKTRKRKAFKFAPFSKKQKQLLTWWMPGSGVSDKEGIIADGSIRSGKSVAMSLSFVIWSLECHDGVNFALCGKTIGAFKRNVWFWLVLMLRGRGYKIAKAPDIAENCYTISKGHNTNYYYLFGAKDERAQDLIQGITLAGVLFDEVALMPQSFVNQATGRCSIEGSKIWFNCNPQGPKHWFKVDWIDQRDQKDLLYLHFTMDDNLSLSEKVKNKYKKMYSGLFFQRYILGLWKLAEGAIYDMFDESIHVYKDGSEDGPDLTKPVRRYYSMDYGTKNPFACLEIVEQRGIYYVDNLYYYDSKKKLRQKDDQEYVKDIKNFIGDKQYITMILDPSALSFKVALKRAGFRVKDADNDVLDGIRLVIQMICSGKLKVNAKCKDLIDEFSAYLWDEKAAEKGKEIPVKANDHALDALRYFVKTIIRILRT